MYRNILDCCLCRYVYFEMRQREVGVDTRTLVKNYFVFVTKTSTSEKL